MLTKRTTYITAISGYLLLSYCVYFIVNKEMITFLTRETGFFETIGAVSFLITSIIFFYLFIKINTENKLFGFVLRRNIFFLLLGIVFFIAFGEEISWGKRVFWFQIIADHQGLNVKQGLTVHNLTYFYIEELTELFELFWLPYCLIIPLISKYSRKFSKFFKEINLPLAPIWVGLLFLLNYFLDRIFSNIDLFISDQNHPEVFESNYAVLFLILSLYFLLKYKKRFTV